ncbi:hypothetical protein [Burkholderia sp. B21-007]|uniref:hypothetical protein n=1 Tax=Burkholderia sp. B21-007 TaxID=2890407 RepID=UPI001E50986A|nr:hypothetical protein [Burkholderia sp. B21-007]UEP33121.1 hypothetical protein LMA01_33105 [Burkholderia sp. B21-007]
MQKALRGGDSPAILILSININRPVATGRRQGFPEFAGTSFTGLRGDAQQAMQPEPAREAGSSMPRGHIDWINQY